jgi:hypothetical protein
MTSCPGSWVVRSKGDDYLGTFLTQRAARRAIERRLEAATESDQEGSIGRQPERRLTASGSGRLRL